MKGGDACIQNTIPAQYKDIRLVKGNLQKEELIKTGSTYNADILKFKHCLHYTSTVINPLYAALLYRTYDLQYKFHIVPSGQ